MSLDLTPQQCNLEYWLGAVAQGKSPKDEEAGFEMLKKIPNDLSPEFKKAVEGSTPFGLIR